MKNSRKIVLSVLLIAVILASVFAFASCGKKYVQQTDTAVYFTIDEKIMPNVEGKTLKDYMDALVEKKELTYSGTDSQYGIMLDTINDLKADATKGEYWFLYSNDDEYSNEAWGTYVLNETTYKSTTLGASSLPIKMGKTYVFMVSKAQ